MKKSNILFIASVMSCVVGITAANIKLKSEYDNKKIASYYKEISLPPFHHIKEMTIPDSANFSLLDITVASSANPGYQLLKPFYADIENNLNYQVINDTLYIRINKPFIQGNISLTILCNNLESIEGRHSRIFVNNFHSEKFKVNAEHVSSVKMQDCEIKRLMVQGKNDGTVVLADKCKIDSAFFQMTDKSILSLHNNQIRYKEFLFGEDATLNLRGEVVKEFIPVQKQ
jgi:hypothetical protein